MAKGNHDNSNRRIAFETAYRSIFNIHPGTKLTKEHMTEMGQLSIKLQTFPGSFPGETEDMISIRERDKTIANGNYSNFIGEMRVLNLWRDDEDKWLNIWRIYRDYVKYYDSAEANPTDTQSVVSAIVEGEIAEPEVYNSSSAEEAAAAAVVRELYDKSGDKLQEAQSIDLNPGDDTSSNIKPNPKEETKMAETITLTPEQLSAMAGGAPSTEKAEDTLKAFGGSAPLPPTVPMGQAAATGISTNVTVLDEQQQAVAARTAEGQIAKRGAWSQSHKIQCFILGHRPLRERLLNPDKTTYPVVNPKKTLESVLKRVFDETDTSKLPVSVLTGKDPNGVIIIPDSVRAAGSDDNYKEFISLLVSAIDNKDVETEVSLKFNFNGYKGVKLTEDVSDNFKRNVLKWKETRKIAADYSLMGISTAADDAIGLKVIVIKLTDSTGKPKTNLSISEAADLCQIRVADGGSLVDKETGAIKNPSLVQYAFNQEDVAAQDPLRTARSQARFSFKGKFKNSKTQEITTRMMTITANLEVPVKKETTPEEYKIFENTIGKPVVMNTNEEANATVNNFIKAQIATNSMSADVRAAHAAAAVASRQTDADAANQMMAGMGA